MIWLHPHALWLLISLPIVGLTLWRAADQRQLLISTCGTGCLALAIVALAMPVLTLYSSSIVPTILVVDLSPSASDAAIVQARKLIDGGLKPRSIIGFSNRAEVAPDLTSLEKDFDARQRLNAPLWPDDPTVGGSALASALQLAAAQSADGPANIMLVSNGLQTRGDAQAEAHRLIDRGITIQTSAAPVTTAGMPEFAVRSLSLPATARLGETVVMHVKIEADHQITEALSIKTGRSPAASFKQSFAPGLNKMDLPIPLHELGLVSVQLTMGQSAVSNAAIFVTAPSSILLVTDPSDQGIAPALTSLLGDSAAVVSRSPGLLSSTDLSQASVIVLNDTPITELSPAIQQQILNAVHHGTGLMVSGAAKSFGPGGYADSKLADALPLKPAQQLQETDPVVSVVLIVDTSGSMYGQKLAICKEMCRLVISHLHPQDKVGVIEFFGGMRWAAPIQPVGDGEMLNRVISRFTAGGDNKLYPAIEDAGEALANVEARSKHILVMSDGDDEVAPFSTLAQSLSEQGINISAAATMPDPGERNVMPDVARWGRGRLYTVPDRFSIPDIKFKEPKPAMVSPLVLKPTAILPGDDGLLRDLSTSQWPAIEGYVRTTAKPTSDVLLQAGDGSPLLARWQFGGGQVAALPTQLGSALSQQLAQTPAFAHLLAGLFRELSAAKPSQPLQISTQIRPAGLEVAIDWATPDQAAPQLLHLSLSSVSRPAYQQDLICTSPGHWDALFPAVTSGNYRIDGKADQAIATAAVAINPPAAFPRLSSDQDLLNQLSTARPSVEDQSLAAAIPSLRTLDLRQILIPLAVLFLLLYVAARRWPIQLEKEVIV
jgi:hypothetical protein